MRRPQPPSRIPRGVVLRLVPGGQAPSGVPNGEPSDATLVLRAGNAEPAAEEQLYRRHVRYVRGLVTRLLRSHIDAEDAVQETFAIALERLPELRDPHAFRPWIAAIAVSQVRRILRRKRLLGWIGIEARVEDATLESYAAEGADPDARIRLGEIDRVLARIGHEARVAWMLRHVEGEELTAVAELTGCSLATAKRRIAAASAQIAAVLGREEAM